MNITEYQWKSFDGLALYALKWTSDEKPEAVVAFVHGHGDHCRRYDEWFSMLVSKNIAVVAFDYRGHGRSQGRRGVVNRFDDFLKDVHLLHENTKSLFPGVPVVLFGHSMGATIVLSYILRSEYSPELAIATSPWLQLKKPPGKCLSLSIKIGSRLAPCLTFKTGLHAEDFSESNGYAEKRDKDGYVHNRISARLFSEVEKESYWIKTHFTELKTPLLLMQGRDDKIMQNSTARSLNEGAPGQVNYREWKNAGHQLQNSEQSSEVIDYIIDWIKEGI
jgi:alpha-beta hydrolase superfamily lysophospholipase